MSDDVPTRSPEFWTPYYLEEAQPWAIEEPCPPVFNWLKAQPDWPRGRVLVPGCGLGLEPQEWARQGFEVVGMDFSPKAIELAKARDTDKSVDYRVGDILNPPEELRGQFDMVFEQTCYCAIDPRDRPRYRRSVIELLKPGGWLVGVFYQGRHEESPPFAITLEEVRQDFEQAFRIERLELAQDSVERRKDQEWFAVFQKESASS